MPSVVFYSRPPQVPSLIYCAYIFVWIGATNNARISIKLACGHHARHPTTPATPAQT